MWTSITAAMCSTSPPQSDGQASLFFPIPPSASIATGGVAALWSRGSVLPPCNFCTLYIFDNNCQSLEVFYATLPEMACHHQQSY